MINLYVGKKNCGKSKLIKSRLDSLQKPVIIFDYKEKYQDIGSLHLNLANVDPFCEALNLEQCCAVNAGLKEYSQFLYKRCEEVFYDFGDCLLQNNSINIIHEALNRAQNGWDNRENELARLSKRFLQFGASKDSVSLSSQLSQIQASDIVVISSSNLHSNKTRILTFLILLYLQSNFEKYSIVSDNINYLWREGHIFHFKKVYDFSKPNFVLSLNKTDVFPEHFIPMIAKANIFKLETNADVNFFKSLGIDINTKAKHLSRGEFSEHILLDSKEDEMGTKIDAKSLFEVDSLPYKLKEAPIKAAPNIAQLEFIFD